jgi:hypothetical protein
MGLSPESFLAVMTLAMVYVFGGRFLGEDASNRFWARRRWVSAAGGVSVAYVFVDVLPELAAQQQGFFSDAGNAGRVFAEGRIYAVALLAFVVLYGLDYIVLASKAGNSDEVAWRSRFAYRLHLFGFAVYSGLIGYLVVERSERGLLSLAIYTFAMVLHFLVVGHSLSEQHGRLYRERGRWLLAGTVLAGWALGTNTRLPEAVFAYLFAVLAGGVVITSLKDELPDDRRGRFWPFCTAALLSALVLLWSQASQQAVRASIVQE